MIHDDGCVAQLAEHRTSTPDARVRPPPHSQSWWRAALGLGHPPVKGNGATLAGALRSRPRYSKGTAMTHDPGERDEKRRALEDFYGGEVPDSTVDRVLVRDIRPEVFLRSVN